MNDDNENVLIIAYNLFCTILIPAVIVLIGIWSLESESDFTHGRTGGLPMGALTVFVPEVISVSYTHLYQFSVLIRSRLLSRNGEIC